MAMTEMIWGIRSRTRTFLSRVVSVSSFRVFVNPFRRSPVSGFDHSVVGSPRNTPNPNTTKLAKDDEARLSLLPSVERDQVPALKASSNSLGVTQELINYRVKNMGKTDGGQDLFAEMKQRFLSFKEQKYFKELEHFQAIADAQYPKFMVIACADSRVCPSNILGFQPGEAFMIRNVANLVPPLENGPSETNAALEFAVNTLEVGNIFVIGHSSCAGIQTLMRMQDNEDSRSFVEKWVVNGEAAKLRTKAKAGHFSFDQQCRHCEKESVNRSLLNLLTYPWIQERVRKELLSIHGGYYDFLNCTFEKWTLDLKGSGSGEEGGFSVKDQAFWY